MNPSKIEEILRHAPRPPAPPQLKERLYENAPAAEARRRFLSRPWAGGTWLSRWWPALASTAILMACAAAFTVQQFEIRSLRDAMSGVAQSVDANEPGSSAAVGGAVDPPATSATVEETKEVARLQALVTKLTEEIAQLEQTHAEAGRLRAQLAAHSAAVLSPEETAALEETRQRALSIQCVNNLKQLGLSIKTWALDNGDMTPPDLLSMTNEMSTPRILVCPADTDRQAAAGWSLYSIANCSYEYLAPGVPDDDPQRVAFRCPVHGHVGLCDGSVQGSVGKTHPEWLVTRDGKLYFQAGPR